MTIYWGMGPAGKGTYVQYLEYLLAYCTYQVPTE